MEENVIKWKNYMCIFLTKKRKRKLVEKWISEHPEQQFYMASNDMVGDATGPMSPGRYTTIDTFYYSVVRYWKD